jgi:hypothetical protein
MTDIDNLILEFRIYDSNRRWEEQIIPNLGDLKLRTDITPGQLLDYASEKILLRIGKDEISGTIEKATSGIM